jgi:transposase
MISGLSHLRSSGGLVPALPSSVLEPLWVQVAALLPTRQDTHPLGCHRPRIPDQIIFDKLIQVLVFGCGFRRIADHTCSATTLRRRRDEWIALGLAERVRLAVLAAYDRLLGLELAHLAVDGCITKAPCGGEVAGRSPVDRGKQGLKRSVVTEAGGIPLGAVPAAANRRDDGLLAATLDTVTALGVLSAQAVVHLDAGYDYQPCRQVLAKRGLVGQIATRGMPAPIQAGRRWPVERTHAWGNQYGKLRWCTERRRRVVEFWLALANAAIVLGRLVRRAWVSYRWQGRPRRRP